MANILSKITSGKTLILVVDADPSVAGGTVAPAGSYASMSDGSGQYYKNSSTDTDWIKTDVFAKYSVTIDGKTTGSTLIGTPPRNFIITNIIYYASNIAGLISLPTFSIGTNGASYNNLVTATILAVITATNDITYATLLSAKGYVGANTGIYVNNTLGAVGTTVGITIDIIGYFK